METATKAPVGVRPADKVLQALATLAALIDSTIREVKSLDSEFQTRLLQAVHETEATLQTQTAEHVERARHDVQLELGGKFQNDLQSALNGIKSEFETERERFNKDLLKASEAVSRLEAERSTLAAQVERVKEDSATEIAKAHEELKNAVHKTEVLLQAETAESIERTRREVQEELKGKFQTELQAAIDGLKAEFDAERQRARENAMKAVQDTEGQLKAQTAEQIERTRQDVQEELKGKFQKDLQSTIDGLKAEFEAERQKARENAMRAVQDTEGQLKAQAAEQVEHARLEVQEQLSTKHKMDLQAALDALKGEFEVERGRLNEVASQLELERAGLITEVQQVKTDSDAQIEKARAEAKAAAVAAAKQAAPAGPSAPPAALQQEIERSETKLQEILKLIDNPATELSTVIRKNVERSELEAYLKGIRLVLGTKS